MSKTAPESTEMSEPFSPKIWSASAIGLSVPAAMWFPPEYICPAFAATNSPAPSFTRRTLPEIETVEFVADSPAGTFMRNSGGISGTADESKYSSWTSSRYGPLLAVLVSLESVNEMR